MERVIDVFLNTLGLDLKSMGEEKVLEALQEMPAEKILDGQKNFTVKMVCCGELFAESAVAYEKGLEASAPP